MELKTVKEKTGFLKFIFKMGVLGIKFNNWNFEN